MAPRSLGDAERAAWRRLCADDRRYRSPFFHPDYIAQVSCSVPGIEVAVCDQGEAVTGFFPFCRSASGVGRPVGGRLSDYHGPILMPTEDWDARALIQGCGLTAYPFTHLPAGTPGFRPFEWAGSESPFLDLKAGFDVYCRERRAAGSRLIRQVQRKARKLEREQGPVRFVWQEGSPEVLGQLLAWKAAQRRQTRTYNVLSEAWARATVEGLHRVRGDEFEGVLSGLYAGDRLLAVHFGLRTASTMHWWFPAFDRDAGRYSPGLILLLELARACADRGISCLDLGKGHEPYKDGFSSGVVPLAEGSVDTRWLAAAMRRGTLALRERIRSSPLHEPMRGAKGWYRALRYR